MPDGKAWLLVIGLCCDGALRLLGLVGLVLVLAPLVGMAWFGVNLVREGITSDAPPELQSFQAMISSQLLLAFISWCGLKKATWFARRFGATASVVCFLGPWVIFEIHTVVLIGKALINPFVFGYTVVKLAIVLWVAPHAVKLGGDQVGLPDV